MNSQAHAQALDLAYEYIIASYDWARDRLDKVNDRLQALQSIVVAVTLAVPVFVKSVLGETANFASIWFILPMVLFVLTTAIGLVAQASGTITLLNPKVLHDKYLGFDEEEFKKNALRYAGEHSEKNHKTVRRKGNAMGWMTGLFIAETVLLVIWVAVT